jgi:Sigma-70, region 4
VIAVDIVGLSYREAARALRVREATITTRLHRGRQQSDARYPLDDYGVRLEEMVAEGNPMRAAKYFMRNGVGLPAPFLLAMPLMPGFKKFAANGLTLTFDYAALGEQNMHGRPLMAEEWARSPAQR